MKIKSAIRATIYTATLLSIISCGGGGDTKDNVDAGGGTNDLCPNASNSRNRFPSDQRCDFYKTFAFMTPYSGMINLLAYYGDSGDAYLGSGSVHNGVDYQTSDVAGKKCEATQNCTEHPVYSPAEGKVIGFNSTYGAVILESQRTENNSIETFNYAVLHLKSGSFDHLRIGQWIPMGKRLGIQWNTSSVNGSSSDISGHVHLEFSSQGTNRVLTQRQDDSALSPANYISWINRRIDEISQKKSLMRVSGINVTGQAILGNTVTIRVTGTSFPPSAFLGIWTQDTSDQSIASCDDTQPLRGTINGVDFLEQQCKLKSIGQFNIFVKAKSEESTIQTQGISVTSGSNTVNCVGNNGIYYSQGDSETITCPTGQTGHASRTCQSQGAWSSPDYSSCSVQPAICTGTNGGSYSVGQQETLSCPSGQTGSQSHTCQPNGTWGTTTGTCTTPIVTYVFSPQPENKALANKLPHPAVLAEVNA